MFEQLINDAEKPISGLSVIQFKNGEITDRAGFGLHGSPSSRFRIASISKFVMTMAVAQAAEAGLLDLDADISEMLGFELRHPSYPDIPITFKHLLSHTSTVRDATAYSMPLPHKVREFFEPGTVWFEDGAHFAPAEQGAPGRYFTYCNLNYGLAASALERVTGQRFDLYMRDVIFRPLGISPSYNVSLFDSAEIAQLAPIMRLENGGWQPQVDDHAGVVPPPLSFIENPDVHEKYVERFGHVKPSSDLASYELGSNGTVFSPQGSLRISADELFVLYRNFWDAHQMGAGWTKMMLNPLWRFNGSNGNDYAGLMRAWGLGTHLFEDQLAGLGISNRNLVGHLGDAYGLLSGLLFDPRSGDGVIYIIGGTSCAPEQNPGRNSPFTAWEEEILKTLL